MATLAAVTNIPALALLGEGGKLERSTEPFRRWYEDKEELCRSSAELTRVLEGQAHAAVLKVDGIAVDIAAMADRDGGRHVLMTVPTGALPSLGDPGEALLDGALDESPALVWLKDLDGRYVRVNSRFTTLLGTSEDRLLGRSDAELPPAETVDGPRAQGGTEGVEEPLQLEYMVGPFQGRAAFVVLRFPVGDRQGVPTLVCGVAAPSSEAHVARSEAARLLRVERWSRLDAESVRAELLAEWGLLPDVRGTTGAAASAAAAPPGSAEHEAAVAEARAERAAAVAERETALAANEMLTSELAAARAQLDELERALQVARADGERGDAEAKLAQQAAELDRALARERERAEELERTLTLVRQRLGDDAEAARAEVQRARADADAARTEVQRARADAEAARTDLEKARADAEAVRAAAAAERDAAASARTELEREVRKSHEQLAALERQHGSDDSGAQLRASEKARVAAEAALVDAVAERDAALKGRVVLEGELEQERNQTAAMRESSAAAEERIRDLVASLERERVRAAGLEEAQARAHELEAELRAAAMRADKAEVELELAVGRADRAESELQAAVARADESRGDDSGAQLLAAEKVRATAEAALTDAVAERDAALKARVVLEGELEQERQQVAALRESSAAAEERIRDLAAAMERERVRAEGLEQAQARVKELEGELRSTTMRADKAEVELQVAAGRVESLEIELQTAVARADKARGDDSGAQLLAAEKVRAAAETALAEAVAERDAALKARVMLEGELEQERRQVASLRESCAAAEERIRDLAAGMERERVRAEGLEQAQARANEIEGELRAAAMRADKAEVEAEHWLARVKQGESDLERAQTQVHALEDKLALGRTRIDELEAEVKTGRERVEEVERLLDVGQSRLGALEAEVKVGRAMLDELEGQLELGRGRIDELEGELEAGRARIDELEGELEAGRARVDELEGELEVRRARIGELEDELGGARATEEKTATAEAAGPKEEVEAQVEEVEPEVASVTIEGDEPQPDGEEPSGATATELATLESLHQVKPIAAGGVSWQPTAKRNLSASLARESVWRNVLKETVQVLGSEGGWDSVTAWLPDDANGLGCAAIWTAHRGLDRFEALTLEEPVKRDGSLLDQALQAPHLTWLTDLDAVDDERLQTAAVHGMNSALLLPIRTGNTTIGLLELLTHDTIEPDAQIALSLEASALQLGRFGHLLSLGKSS